METRVEAAPAPDGRQVAEFEMALGGARMGARVSVTPGGVLAIGALVSGVLLSTAVVVWAARGGRGRRG